MTYKLLIDGKLVAGARSLDVVNPATGKVFATCACADAQQLNEAVAAARRSLPHWSGLDAKLRGAQLEALADAILRREDEFARLLTLEQGKPLAQAYGEIRSGVTRLRYFARLELQPVVLRETETEKIIEIRKPLGVLAAITPWNFPFSLLMSKLAPGLAAGNTLVAKPAPTTPLTTCLLGEVAAQVLPAGVVNVIVDANDLGAQLAAHPDVAKVGFTGSTETGKKVMQSAAGTLKRLTLELGGNDAAIVLADADVETVARKVFNAAMLNAGQVCLAVKRVYVHRSLYDAVCEALVAHANRAVVGDGLADGTEIGPVQNRAQYEKVLGMIDRCRSEGRVVAGGFALEREGYFIAPTIVKDLPDSAQIVREEQFGPVLPILAFDDVDDVVRRANDTVFGLGATVWTSDYRRGVEVAERLETGTVWVNRHLDLPPDVPFGGAKQSGIGCENGIEGLKEVTQRQIINIAKDVPPQNH
jgi:acyl-CoA reductase-like NAD-dependent aldehyde dehydrogenase